MLDRSIESEILRLWHAEKWPVGTIARELRVHHSAVRRVINPQEVNSSEKKRRPSKVDPYVPFILETLEKFPRVKASRLFDMVRQRGFDGKPSQFRAIVASIRPSGHREAYLRLRTLPGDQGQVDWGHFGRIQIGRASRPLVAFVIVLSYSRAIFLRFYLSQNTEQFLRAHEHAFEHFGARVPRVLLYDNLKSAVLERSAGAIRFNPVFLAFAGHHRFEARPVAVARGNEKGRVERAIQYVRTRFFEARRFSDLEDLNRQATQWSLSIAMERPWPEDKRITVAEAFEHEKDKLLPANPEPFPCEDRVETTVGKTPYVRFDRNDYSVPHTLRGKPVVIFVDEASLRVLHEGKIVAEHRRSWDQAAQIEDLAHIDRLREEKRAATKSSNLDTLGHATPSAIPFLEIAAKRGGPLGRTTRDLKELLRLYGATVLESALREALESDLAHIQALRHILERDRRESGRVVPRPLLLPDDPRLRDSFVKPHDISTYDRLIHTEDADDDPAKD
jgi:transposase